MKFGVREICDVVFKAKAPMKIGNSEFKKGQPVLYIDSAKTSNLEGAATTVYAQGGAGNTRLIAWEGEKTLTFTVEDALLSPIGFSILSGAGLFKKDDKEVHVHTTATAYIEKNESGIKIDLSDVLNPYKEEEIDSTAPVFVSITEDDGSITGTLVDTLVAAKATSATYPSDMPEKGGQSDSRKVWLTRTGDMDPSVIGKTVFVDFYMVKSSAQVSEIQIDAAHFGGYFYVEASTLFRRQSDGVDMPAELTFPNVKIQSNFTFAMASTGDPSTFSFTMDAFPGYTMFDRTKKVLCVMQVIEDATAGHEVHDSVMSHVAGFDIPEAAGDSTAEKGEPTV